MVVYLLLHLLFDTDNRKNNFSILGEEPTDEHWRNKKKKVLLTLPKQKEIFLCPSITMVINKIDVWKFKAQDNKRWYEFCLGSVLKSFTKDEQS